MTRHFVAEASEIPPGTRRIIKAAGRTIGVFNVGGRLFAVKNSCVHAQAPVCLGEITGTYVSTSSGRVFWERDGQILRCPWHGWEFDVTTGVSVFDANVRLVTYRTVVEEGRVFVEF